jgi:hypothetical protein
MKKSEDIIPKQETGGKTDVHEKVHMEDEKQAAAFFQVVKKRLLDVNQWHALAGKLSAAFRLIDENGNPASRDAQVGDYFKINIPAPGPSSGEGFDWVRIEAIDGNSDDEKETESLGITVRPCKAPAGEGDGKVAHFFNDTATSTFIVERSGKTIQAAVHGRNETPNADQHTVKDKARNMLVAIGAIAGFSNPQWKSLVKGLLKRD